MAYKTIMLKIYDPGKAKREIMDGAITRYSLALQFLLDRCRPAVEAFARSGHTVRRKDLLAVIGQDTLRLLNHFDVQPFKDSLKVEFSSIAAVYIAQKRKNPKARYPRILTGGTSSGAATERHPLYFGRYAVNRDYCLLYDEGTGRYYAKMYLLNRKNKISAEGSPGRLQLRCLYRGMPEAPPSAGDRRFLVTPLAFGKHQLKELSRLRENPRLAHTARLKKIKNDYYLLVNITCAEPAGKPETARIGIARNTQGGLHYTVQNLNAQTIASGSIEKPAPECQKLYLLAKEVVRLCRQYNAQAVLEANGGKNDGLTLKETPHGDYLTTTEYARLVKILRYRLPEEGLAAPVETSANRLFSTCPSCDAACRKSRISTGLFICVKCGYAAAEETVASLNLVKRLQKYAKDKVPVNVAAGRNGIVFKNAILGFECTLPSDCTDYSQMYYELNLFVHSAQQDFEANPKKFAMLKKLREAPEMAQAVRIVEQRRKTE